MNSYLKIAEEQLLVFFEQHLYVLADLFGPGNLPLVGNNYLKTTMNFFSDQDGQFIMLFPENRTKEFMSNFLGLDPDDPQIAEISSFDMASEIINILGAHIISLLPHTEGLLQIGIPETSIFSDEDREVFFKDDNITGISIDGEAVLLKIVFKK